jgi:murein DD-endopeptidase MepM/ murein hydrolase activator NlpD
MAKTASQVFTEARKSAFRDAKAFVEKVPETGKVKKKPYRQAYAALRKKYAPVVLGHASGADERVRIGLRLDRMIRDALGAAGITPYVSPVTARTRRMRTDSGVDFQGEPGDPVRAMGKAEVTSSRRVGGFGMLVVYRLLEGPREGQHVYVGHAEPCVKKGDLVKAGAPVATLREHAWGRGGGARARATERCSSRAPVAGSSHSPPVRSSPGWSSRRSPATRRRPSARSAPSDTC